MSVVLQHFVLLLEKTDSNFLDTARREFVEETGDAGNLSNYLTNMSVWQNVSQRSPPLGSVYYERSKLAMVLCQVPTTAIFQTGKSDLAGDQFLKHANESGPHIECKDGVLNKISSVAWVDSEEIQEIFAHDCTYGYEVQCSLGVYPLYHVCNWIIRRSSVSQCLGYKQRNLSNITNESKAQFCF